MESESKKRQADINSKIQRYLNPTYIRRGILIFLSITLLSFTILFVYTNTQETVEALLGIQFKYVVFALGLAFFDWWIGGWRNHMFVRELKPGISQRVCFDANLANIFIGAVTPSQTGGAPAQLYILHRNGIKLVDGIAVSVVNYIPTALFFPISSALALYYLQDQIQDHALFTFLKSGLFLFCTAFTIILLSLFLPQTMGRFFISLARWVRSWWAGPGAKMERACIALAKQLEDYHGTMMFFLRKKPFLLPLSFVITWIMYLNKYTLAFVLLLALGVQADYLTVISIQAVIFFILYFAPSPGGSGIAELSIAVLMAQIIPDAMITSFTLLHRAFLLFLPAIVGAVIVLSALRRHTSLLAVSEEDGSDKPAEAPQNQ